MQKVQYVVVVCWLYFEFGYLVWLNFVIHGSKLVRRNLDLKVDWSLYLYLYWFGFGFGF